MYISGHQISRYITSVQQWHKYNFITLNRKQMGTLALLIKSFKKKQPAKSHKHRPITIAIIKLWLPYFGNSVKNITYKAAISVAYAHMLRAGEYVCAMDAYKIDPRYRLNWNDITFGNDTLGIPMVLQIRIKLPKSYGYKFKPEYTLSLCTCNTLPLCALHDLLRLWYLVKPLDLTNPVFALEDKWITPTKMKSVINILCDYANLDGKYYTCHMFRSGKCTDLKCNGTDDTIICKLGRWNSDVWKKHYLLLDMFDVLRLTQ